jgi:hypothetical protein
MFLLAYDTMVGMKKKIPFGYNIKHKKAFLVGGLELLKERNWFYNPCMPSTDILGIDNE